MLKNLVRRLLRKNKSQRLDATAAMKDVLFINMKEQDQLMQSMTLNKFGSQQMLKLSERLDPNNLPSSSDKKGKAINILRKFTDIEEEPEINIYGFDSDIKF